MQLLQPDEGSCRSEILHARVYGLDLSQGIAKVEIFFAGLKKIRVQTDGGREHRWLTLATPPVYLLTAEDELSPDFDFG